MHISRLRTAIESIGDRWRRRELTHVPVMITGETGSGKEYFARQLAAGAGLDMSVVNLAAIGDTMASAELFGHERGAYTGATTSRVGLLESAGDGIVILDEIGKTSLAMQSALLRAIDSREIRRVGSNRVRRFSASIIMIASEDIEGEINAGRFHRDLWERVGARLHVAPLRERRDEITGLIGSFSRRYGVDVDDDVYTWAKIAPWRGNVREVLRTIEAGALIDGRVTRRGCIERTAALTIDDLLARGASAQEIVLLTGERYNTCWQRLHRRVKRGELTQKHGRFYLAASI